MIIESVLSIVKGLLFGVLDTVDFFNFPTDFFSGLATFMGYGNFVVGGDLLFIVLGSVCFWYGVRLAVAMFTFIYRLIPFI